MLQTKEWKRRLNEKKNAGKNEDEDCMWGEWREDDEEGIKYYNSQKEEEERGEEVKEFPQEVCLKQHKLLENEDWDRE